MYVVLGCNWGVVAFDAMSVLVSEDVCLHPLNVYLTVLELLRVVVDEIEAFVALAVLVKPDTVLVYITFERVGFVIVASVAEP